MQEDFTRSGPVYDLILDVAASRSLFDYKRALKPAGIFVMIGCSTLLLFQMLCIAPWLKSSSPYNRENKR
jgi:hypothetical protein